jgi:hypothetical protein
MVETDVTIDYTYDPLYRLTAADYSSGDYFYYGYDAVGNRLQRHFVSFRVLLGAGRWWTR